MGSETELDGDEAVTLPLCEQMLSVRMMDAAAVFEFETEQGQRVELPVVLEALPDLATGIAAVLHAVERGDQAS
jgi:hypothetical protein